MAIKGDVKQIGLWLSGQPVQIAGANLFLTQPKIKDIVLFGEDDFLLAVNLLTRVDQFVDSIKQGNSELEIYSDFQLLMIIMREDPQVKNLLENMFSLVFPDYIIKIEDMEINFFAEVDEEQRLVGKIYPFNFENLQVLLSDLFLPQGDDKEIDYNPANEAAAAIKEKLMKGREKRKAQQIKQEGESSLFARYISTLSIGIPIDMNILYNYTPFQIYDLFKRYFVKQAYDLDMRVRTMPLMDTSNMGDPEDWTKNLYK